MEIRRITRATAGDLRLKNEPFSKPGRLIPALENGIWSCRAEWFESPQWEVFPEEDYDFEVLDREGIVFGAYDGGRCIGLAIYQNTFFKHLYLSDLKVSAAARGKGAGRALVEAGWQAARDLGYQGLTVTAQDDNLNACLFYLKLGFQIGGFDNQVYSGTSQAGKADIIFYLR